MSKMAKIAFVVKSVLFLSASKASCEKSLASSKTKALANPKSSANSSSVGVSANKLLFLFSDLRAEIKNFLAGGSISFST